MCLSVPARIVALDGERRSATVDVLGAMREASVLLLPEVAEGDWVLVHVGFAIARIDEDEAAATLALLDEALAADPDDRAEIPPDQPERAPGDGTDGPDEVDGGSGR